MRMVRESVTSSKRERERERASESWRHVERERELRPKYISMIIKQFLTSNLIHLILLSCAHMHAGVFTHTHNGETSTK